MYGWIVYVILYRKAYSVLFSFFLSLYQQSKLWVAVFLFTKAYVSHCKYFLKFTYVRCLLKTFFSSVFSHIEQGNIYQSISFFLFNFLFSLFFSTIEIDYCIWKTSISGNENIRKKTMLLNVLSDLRSIHLFDLIFFSYLIPSTPQCDQAI